MVLMPIPQRSIAKVVEQASRQMHDPKYISGEVDRFICDQSAISQLVIAASNELTVEGVVMVLFHAALMSHSMKQAGTAPRLVTIRDLEQAGRTTPSVEVLADDEPDLASYIASNVEPSPGFDADLARLLLARVARAMVG